MIFPEPPDPDMLARIIGDANRRHASSGPLVATATFLRDWLGVVRFIVDEMEAFLLGQLELLDAQLRLAFGQRWWETMRDRLADDERGETRGR